MALSICLAELVALSRRRESKTSVQQWMPTLRIAVHLQAAVNDTRHVYVCDAKSIELW